MQRFGLGLAAAAVGLLACVDAAPVLAKTEKACRADYAAKKDALAASGQSEKDFIAACKAEAAAAPAKAPASGSADNAPVVTKTKAQCTAEYNANIAVIKANGQSKAAFDADCRAGVEKIKPVAAKP